jgi:alpha-glucosidase
MRPARGFDVRLPADWPPASVTVNGVAVKKAGPTGKGGWSFEGNTLTTVIPVQSTSVQSKVTVEIRRAAGLTARRGELDGFAGAMALLRGAYDAMHKTEPVSDPPETLVDAMQSGDRMGYHPENATEEIAHFHQMLPKAQAELAAVGADFSSHVEEYIKRYAPEKWLPGKQNLKALEQSRIDAMARAQKLVTEAGK